MIKPDGPGDLPADSHNYAEVKIDNEQNRILGYRGAILVSQ